MILEKSPFNLKDVRTLFGVPAPSGDSSWGWPVTVVIEDAFGGGC